MTFPRTLTPTEREHERTLKTWALALAEGRTFPKDIRGSSRWVHDNCAGSDCYGMSPHYHVHYHTNHRPNHERIAP